MIRRYTADEFVERVESLRKAVPGITLSTDVIVGFPGETREDFAATLSLVDRLQFVGLFGFKYSERPGTPSLRLTNDVSDEESSARLEELFTLNDTYRRSYLASLVGTQQTVLVEARKPDGAYTGRTERNEIVHLPCRRDVTGQLVDVTIRAAFKNSLAAEAIDPEFSLPISALPRLERKGDQAASVVVAPASEVGKAKRALTVVSD
jgi:tRNA-2-methylthio-N6-dimethylallyladenosine synthase